MSFKVNDRYQEAMRERVNELAFEGQHEEAVKLINRANEIGLSLGVEVCKHNRVASYCSKCENEVDEAIGN